MLFLLLVSAGGTCVAQSSPEEKLSMTLYAIRHIYVDSVDLSPVVEQQIKDLVERLDPHSEYLQPDVAKANEQLLMGATSPSGDSLAIQGGEAPSGIVAAYMDRLHYHQYVYGNNDYCFSGKVAVFAEKRIEAFGVEFPEEWRWLLRNSFGISR